MKGVGLFLAGVRYRSAECVPGVQKEKGHTANATLWGNADGDQLSGASFDFRRWRRLISPLIEVTTNPARLSSFSFTFSSSLIKSSGTLETICCDLLLREPVAITEPPCNRWHSVYAINNSIQVLKWHSLTCIVVNATNASGWGMKTARLGSAPTPTGL